MRSGRRYFGGDRDILNQAVKLDGHTYTVIGVMPAGFRFPLSMRDAIYTPMHLDQWWMNGRGNHWLQTIGRLKDGVTMGQAQADLTQVFSNLGRAYPDRRRPDGADLNRWRNFVAARLEVRCGPCWARFWRCLPLAA